MFVDPSDRADLLVPQEHEVNQVPRDNQEPLELKDHKDREALQDSVETMVHKVLKVQLVSEEPQERVVNREQPVHQDFPVQLVNQEQLERSETQDQTD